MTTDLSTEELIGMVVELQQKVSRLEGRDRGLEEATFDTGNTAWILTSSAFVLMMTIPGLALFYGGMSKTKNVLTTVMQSFSIVCVISVVWMICGYTLAFGPANANDTSSAFIGDFSMFWCHHIDLTSVHQLAPDIPETVFFIFELTFAVITPALICGSFADRAKYGSTILFVVLWHLTVYCPIAHWNWHPDGFLNKAGVLDYAGGNVIEISCGVSGLIATIVIGKGAKFGTEKHESHSILYTVTGACLLWVGWYGFNGGSALNAGERAGMSILVTQIATSTAALSWMLTELWFRKQPSVLGTINGAIAGLVSITPACGYVDNTGGFFIGLFAGPICFFGANLKHKLGYDDALDAFGIHGIGGIFGGIMTGLFATAEVCGENGVFYDSGPKGWNQLGIQIYGVVICGAYSAVLTFLIAYGIEHTIGFRVSKEFEEQGLDGCIHGETVDIQSAPITKSLTKVARRLSTLVVVPAAEEQKQTRAERRASQQKNEVVMTQLGDSTVSRLWQEQSAPPDNSV